MGLQMQATHLYDMVSIQFQIIYFNFYKILTAFAYR